MATMATNPKPCVAKSPPNAEHTPNAKGSKKLAVIAPEATPPESKAIAVNISGTKKVKTNAIKYPGIKKYIMLRFNKILSIASPTENAMPIIKLPLNACCGIPPEVTS